MEQENKKKKSLPLNVVFNAWSGARWGVSLSMVTSMLVSTGVFLLSNFGPDRYALPSGSPDLSGGVLFMIICSAFLKTPSCADKMDQIYSDHIREDAVLQIKAGMGVEGIEDKIKKSKREKNIMIGSAISGGVIAFSLCAGLAYDLLKIDGTPSIADTVKEYVSEIKPEPLKIQQIVPKFP